MKQKRKKLNEDGDFSILRHPSPYRIGRAPAPTFNADEQMKHNYLIRAAEEANTFNQKLQLAGKLEHIEPLIRDFYKQYAYLYHFLDEQLNDPTIPEAAKQGIVNIQSKLDGIGKVVIAEIIPEIDNLVAEPSKDL